MRLFDPFNSIRKYRNPFLKYEITKVNSNVILKSQGMSLHKCILLFYKVFQSKSKIL